MTLALLAGALVLVLFGCSGEVLNPDGTIGTVGGASADPTSTDPSAATNGRPSSGVLALETEPSTGFILGPDTPSDLFADSEHVLRADFLNTGKSDCILLRLDGTVILVDTGETDDYARIHDTLTEYGIETIDYLILSHYDNDHIGTAARILQDFTVSTVYMPDYVRDSGLYRGLVEALTAVADRTAVHRLQEQDVRLELGYGSLWINASGLYTPGMTVGSDANNSGVDENNFSLITSVYFGDISLLLTGDAERDRMEEFHALCTDRYSLVKTPHHGGYDKGLGDFLDDARPRYCVVCTDAKGTVDASLVTKMNSIGTGDYYTYNGDVRFSTDGTVMLMEQGN